MNDKIFYNTTHNCFSFFSVTIEVARLRPRRRPRRRRMRLLARQRETLRTRITRRTDSTGFMTIRSTKGHSRPRGEEEGERVKIRRVGMQMAAAAAAVPAAGAAATIATTEIWT